MTGSPAAYLALLLWIPVSMALFAVMRPTTAAYVGMLTATMFLPERVAFDVPLVPPIDKNTLSALCAIAGVAIKDHRVLTRARPGRGPELLGIVALVGIVGTVYTNRAPLTVGETTLLGLTVHDGLSSAIQLLLRVIVPFYLGRVLFTTKRDLQELLVGLALAGLLYLPFILVELRMSPQLHTWVYGYFQHSWVQTVRGGGYRPVAFMANGLALAMLVFIAATAAWCLKRARVALGPLPLSLPAWMLLATLAAIHSLGALVYALVIIPLLRFASTARQVRVAVLLAGLVLAYPLLRATQVFPTQTLTDWAAQVNEERADSLAYRFYHEDRLLEKALDHPWFGWGSWGRNRVYDAHGSDSSTTDGAWISILGTSGVFGFVAHFGMLLVPIFVARRQLARLRDEQTKKMLAGVALIVAASAVDLLPNGIFNYLPLFLAGALAGLTRGLVNESNSQLRFALVPAMQPSARMVPARQS